MKFSGCWDRMSRCGLVGHFDGFRLRFRQRSLRSNTSGRSRGMLGSWKCVLESPNGDMAPPITLAPGCVFFTPE